MKYPKKILRYGVLALVSCSLFFLWFADYTVEKVSQPKLYSSVEQIPQNTVGVLLGTAKYVYTGRLNAYYSNRITAAVDLYEAGKIQYILVSADNGTVEYNEPTTMKEDLIAQGIPEEDIYLDYAGFRTLDSMVRAKEVFGQTAFTVISQEFHNQRAIYIAEKKGIQAIGYNAQGVPVQRAPRVVLREYLARVKTLLDLYLFQTKPKFLGDPVPIPSALDS